MNPTAPFLNEEFRIQLLAAARELKAESARANLFSALAPFFDMEVKIGLLKEALVGSENSEDLEKIITEWNNIQYQGLQEPAMEFVKRISINDRGRGLLFLNALLPSLIYIEGEIISGEILRAIQDTARWWP